MNALDNLINKFLQDLQARPDILARDKITAECQLRALQQMFNSETMDISVIRQAKRFFYQQDGWLRTEGLNLLDNPMVFEKLLTD